MSFFSFFSRTPPPDPQRPTVRSLELLESTVTGSPEKVREGGASMGSSSLTTRSSPNRPLQAVLGGGGEVQDPFSEIPSNLPPRPPNSESTSKKDNDEFVELADFRRRNSRQKTWSATDYDKEGGNLGSEHVSRETEYNSRERKVSFGLINGGKLAGVGVDEDEGEGMR
jgi:hypothetical protein